MHVHCSSAGAIVHLSDSLVGVVQNDGGPTNRICLMEILVGDKGQMRYTVDVRDFEVEGWPIVEQVSTAPDELSITVVDMRAYLARLIERRRQTASKVSVRCCEPITRSRQLWSVNREVETRSSNIWPLSGESADVQFVVLH